MPRRWTRWTHCAFPPKLGDDARHVSSCGRLPCQNWSLWVRNGNRKRHTRCQERERKIDLCSWTPDPRVPPGARYLVWGHNTIVRRLTCLRECGRTLGPFRSCATHQMAEWAGRRTCWRGPWEDSRQASRCQGCRVRSARRFTRARWGPGCGSS